MTKYTKLQNKYIQIGGNNLVLKKLSTEKNYDRFFFDKGFKIIPVNNIWYIATTDSSNKYWVYIKDYTVNYPSETVFPKATLRNCTNVTINDNTVKFDNDDTIYNIELHNTQETEQWKKLISDASKEI